MKYDFDNLANRRHTSSLKWDVLDNELAMWVADMDFKTPKFITDKMKEIVEFSNFGYKNIPDSYFESYISWWKKRHNVKWDVSDMIFATGVVPAISSIVRKITTVGEKVLVMKPCYNIFFNSIVNNGRFILSSDLIYANGEYSIDFKDLEDKLKDPQVNLMILCNPQNPCGKIYTKEELEIIGKLAYENNVVVLSDEIHCDIVEKGYNYVPFQSVNDINRYNSITCISASKCFSLAGLQGACVVVPNKVLRHKVNRGLNTDEVAEANSFVCETFKEAFLNGEEYINELNDYIANNKKYAYDYIKNNIPSLTPIISHSLYLIWVDISKVSNDSKKFCQFLREKTGLYITEGSEYGECGKTFVRINLGTSLDYVKDGMERLKKGVELYV
jgi:cysteine-S-conjugate beta-lyase